MNIGSMLLRSPVLLPGRESTYSQTERGEVREQKVDSYGEAMERD